MGIWESDWVCPRHNTGPSWLRSCGASRDAPAVPCDQLAPHMALSEPLGHSDPERHRIPGLQKQVKKTRFASGSGRAILPQRREPRSGSHGVDFQQTRISPVTQGGSAQSSIKALPRAGSCWWRFEVGFLFGAAEGRHEAARKESESRVVVAYRLVVAHARHGDAVLRVLQLGL